MQVAEKDVEGREVARRYVLDPKDKELVSCRRCRHVAAPLLTHYCFPVLFTPLVPSSSLCAFDYRAHGTN
jgi:hypothetical protein